MMEGRGEGHRTEGGMKQPGTNRGSSVATEHRRSGNCLSAQLAVAGQPNELQPCLLSLTRLGTQSPRRESHWLSVHPQAEPGQWEAFSSKRSL